MHEEIEIAMARGLDEAIPVGREMEEAGIEVIISRRGAAHLLRENLRIPVLALPVSSLDILTTVEEASAFGKKILLPVFRARMERLWIIEKIFGIELVQEIYKDSRSLEQVVEAAAGKDVDVVIGGGVTMQFAEKYHIQGVEIRIAEESVAFTIEDAKSVARSAREEQERTMRYRCIVDSTSDGIISVDEEGIITTINKAAKGLLKISDDLAEGKNINRFISRASIMRSLQTQKPEHHKLERINNTLFVTNHIPILMNNEVVGGVSTFRDVSNVIKAENEVRKSFAKGLVAKYFIEDLIHKSRLMVDMINKTKRFALSDSTILINGETGTGKEILAHSIHNLCQRRKGPFVSINCAALPDQLLESELFGHEEGAFTGSRKGGKPGLFELAHKGTIFLDEIASTPQSVQTRLLRLLQEKEVMRIGGDNLIPIDVRVIAAANKDLREEVQCGRLREDLYFRLNVLTIRIPPLRERIEDLPILIEELIRRLSKKYSKEPIDIPAPFVHKLMQHPWPGNVRQLENFLERFLLLSDAKFSSDVFHEVYGEVFGCSCSREESPAKAPPSSSLKEYLQVKSQEDGSKMIWKVLEECNMSKSKAAEKLGISRTTLWRKLKEWEDASPGRIVSE
jgi:PAS domain S-box-containing protein